MGDTSLVFNLVAKDQASGEVSAMGERMAAASAGIGMGVGAALGIGIAASMDMESANAKLAAQLGLNEAEAARVGDVSGAVFSAGFGQSLDEVNLALGGVVSAMGEVGDFTNAELQDMTKNAMTLASVFEFDVGEASTAAGQLIKTGLAQNGTEAFDLLTAAAKALPKAMQDDLPSVVSEYSTQFRRLGLDGQTAMGLLAQGAAAGARDIDQVADGIGQFGELALAGGTAAKGAFESIGLNAGEMAKMVGAGGDTATQALGMTLDKLRGTKDEQVKLNAATALFGDPGTVMGDALFALDPAGAAAATGMDKAAGSAGGLVDATSGTASSALQEFKNRAITELAEVAGSFVKFGMANKGVMVPLMYTMAGLAGVVLAVAVAQKVHATYTALSTAATNLQTSAAYRNVAAWMRMMAVGTMAYARIAGAAVLSAAMTAAAWMGSALVSIGTWIAAVVRAAVVSTAQFVLMAARAVAWAVVMAAQWLIAMGPVGWVIAIIIGLVALIIANWDTIKKWTGAAWTWVWDKIKMVGQFILDYVLGWKLVSYFLNHWEKIKTGLANKVVGIVAYVKALPGRIKSAVGDLGGLLTSAGRNIVTGLWNGISGMGSWLAGKLTGFAKAIIPGPIAKALGISSPSKVMATVIGRWIPAGIVDGIESGQGDLERTMSTLVQPPSSSAAMGMGRQMGAASAPLMSNGAAGGMVLVRVDTTGAEGPFKTFIKKVVRVDGRGSVQLAFGEG